MATYPTAKDVFVNPSTTSPTNNPSHAGEHTATNTALLAIETKLGIDSSTDATSIDYKLKSSSSSNPGHKHTLTNGATDVTATAAEINSIHGLTASVTELNYNVGVTSAIQTQLDAKVPKTTTVNGHALSGNVSVTTTDLSLNNVDNTSDATKNAATATLTNKTIVQRVASYSPAGAGTTTLDLSTGGIQTVTMPANTQTLAVSGGTTGQCFLVEINNVTSQGTLTWFTTIRWAGGSAPTLTGTNGKRDVFGFRITGAGTYDGYIIGQNI